MIQIEVVKTGTETSANLIRRFTKRVQYSSILKKARSKQSKKRPQSALAKKKYALKRIQNQNKMAELRKMGKDEPFKFTKKSS